MDGYSVGSLRLRRCNDSKSRIVVGGECCASLYTRYMEPRNYPNLGAPTPLGIATVLTARCLGAIMKLNPINLEKNTNVFA